MGYTLRDYQLEGVQACLEILKSKTQCREIVIAPTAAGKSIYSAETAKQLNEPLLILQPSKELLKQNYEKFIKVGGKATLCCASLKTKTVDGEDYTEINGELIKCREVSRITFATVGTVINYVDKLKKLGVKKIVLDECFPYDTPINTQEGLFRIGDIVKKYDKGEELPKVKSYNENTKSFEYKKILKAKYMGEKPIIKTVFTKGSIESTSKHKFLTIDGWKKVEDLSVGDAVITSYEESGSGYLNLSEDQTAIIIGSGIGDGSFDFRKKGSNIARMKFIQGAKQEQYLKWKSNIMTKNGYVEYIEKNGYSQTEAYRFTTQCFYMPEETKNDDWLINNLTLKSLAILWMDDGHMVKEGNSGSLYTFCHKPEKLKKLKLKIEELGITGTVFSRGKSSSTGTPFCYLRFKKEAIKNISEKCAKYIHPELSYKVDSENRVNVGDYKWSDKSEGVIKVVRGFETLGIKKVYDIEVEDNHNFIVASKSAFRTRNYINKELILSDEGVVVHNCHLMTQSSTQKRGNKTVEKKSQIKKLVNALEVTNICGLTATALYLKGGIDGASLKIMTRTKWKLFTDIKHITQISHLVKNNWWAKLVYKVNETDESLLKHNSSGSDYTVQSLKDFYESNDLKGQIIEELRILLKEGRKSIIVFVPSIKEANDLFASFPNSAIVHSKIDDKTRNYVLDAFKNLDIPVIFNVNILNCGFDHPLLDAIITSRPTSSIAVYYQQIGRGCRIHEEKDNCKIVDFSGNVSKFGRVEELEYCDVPYYGMGLFGKDGVLLTDFPIAAKERPTKESLIEKGKADLNKTSKKTNPMFKYGMYKGRRLWDIAKSKDARRLKSYCSWLWDQHKKGDWKFYGEEGRLMKEGIREYLRLPK